MDSSKNISDYNSDFIDDNTSQISRVSSVSKSSHKSNVSKASKVSKSSHVSRKNEPQEPYNWKTLYVKLTTGTNLYFTLAGSILYLVILFTLIYIFVIDSNGNIKTPAFNRTNQKLLQLEEHIHGDILPIPIEFSALDKTGSGASTLQIFFRLPWARRILHEEEFGFKDGKRIEKDSSKPSSPTTAPTASSKVKPSSSQAAVSEFGKIYFDYIDPKNKDSVLKLKGSLATMNKDEFFEKLCERFSKHRPIEERERVKIHSFHIKSGLETLNMNDLKMEFFLDLEMKKDDKDVPTLLKEHFGTRVKKPTQTGAGEEFTEVGKRILFLPEAVPIQIHRSKSIASKTLPSLIVDEDSTLSITLDDFMYSNTPMKGAMKYDLRLFNAPSSGGDGQYSAFIKMKDGSWWKVGTKAALKVASVDVLGALKTAQLLVYFHPNYEDAVKED